MMPVWVVAAAAAKARILEAESRTAPLEEIEDLVHPASRLQERELVADAGGVGAHRAGGDGGVHSVGHERDAVDEEREAFAREVAEYLNRARQDGRYGRLYVFAAPRFLGMLRKHLHAQTLAALVEEKNLDVTTESVADIRARLPGKL